jgi:methylmalonic aciduria homocystinuria type C protein
MKEERFQFYEKSEWGAVVDHITSELTPRGLDLIHPFQVEWYNKSVPASFFLPDFGRPESLGILVGNTKSLWPQFINAFSRSIFLQDDPHPLDRYVQEQVRYVLGKFSMRWDVRWDCSPPAERIAMQRLAEIAGCATLSSTHLSVHPKFGPWISLRAVIVLDMPGDGLKAPEKTNNLCSDCERSCLPAFERAMNSVRELTSESVSRDWKQWLAVRDACPVGRDEHRFYDNQIRYSYTKDRVFLK